MESYFPEEMWNLIYQNLDIDGLARWNITCKHWNSLHYKLCRELSCVMSDIFQLPRFENIKTLTLIKCNVSSNLLSEIKNLKELCLMMCDNPILFEEGTLSNIECLTITDTIFVLKDPENVYFENLKVLNIDTMWGNSILKRRATMPDLSIFNNIEELNISSLHHGKQTFNQSGSETVIHSRSVVRHLSLNLFIDISIFNELRRITTTDIPIIFVTNTFNYSIISVKTKSNTVAHSINNIFDKLLNLQTVTVPLAISHLFPNIINSPVEITYV